MKKIIGTLLALTMMFGTCPSMLAEDVTGTMTSDITWFEPITLSSGRMVVDGNNVKLVLTAGFSFGNLSVDSLVGTKVKGTFTCKDNTKIDIDAVVTGTGTAANGTQITLLFAKPDGLPKSDNYGTANLKLYPADKITKHNFMPFKIKGVDGLGTIGGNNLVKFVLPDAQAFPIDATSSDALVGCKVNGTVTRKESSDEYPNTVNFNGVTIAYSAKRSDNKIEIAFENTDTINKGAFEIGKHGNYTYDLTISPAPYDADVYASYVAAEETEAAAAPFDKSHVTGTVISGVVNTGAAENTISTGFIKEVSADTNGTQHWEIKLPASGSYVKTETDNGKLNEWISMNLGDAVVTAEDGNIYPISSFTVSEEDKDYITLEFDRPANSTTITTDEDGTTTICGLIIENIYAPGATAAIE